MLHYCIEVLEEFNLHALQIFEGQTLSLDRFISNYRKLSLELLLLIEPLTSRNSIGLARSNNIESSKHVSFLNFDIPCVFERWQHEGSYSIHHELDRIDIITLEEDVLIITIHSRGKQWAEP